MAGSGPSRAGTRFGHYELQSLLGRGGMGEVYTAFDTVKDRTVALKLLPQELASDPGYQERFRREARTAARLQEPHIIPIHDFGEIDGVLFIDMRLVPGQDLRSVLRASGALSPGRAVAIVSQVASALDAAHADGLVHRDVKPENVLITDGDFAYLADFGIASRDSDVKLTEHGSAIGSMAYMAPERFDEAPVTPRADVYSLGCLIHECLTGAAPFAAKTVSAQIKAHLYEPPPRVSGRVAGVPAGIDDVLQRAMAKNPAARFRSAGELAVEAQRALAAPDQAEATTIMARTGGGEPRRNTPLPRTAPHEVTQEAPFAQAPAPQSSSTARGFDQQYSQPHAHPQRLAGPQQPAAPPERSSSLMPVLVTLLTVAVLALGGLLIWLNGQKDDTKEAGGLPSAPSSAGTAGPNAATTTSGASTSAAVSTEQSASDTVRPPAPVTTTSVPAPSQTSTPPGLSGPGYDRQGWVATSAARCNADDPAVLVARSATTRIAICQTGSGGLYYRGYSTKSGNGIEIDHPTRTASGWQVFNDGFTYDISRSELRIHQGGETQLTEPMQDYQEPS